jgi:hypothetical protein
MNTDSISRNDKSFQVMLVAVLFTVCAFLVSAYAFSFDGSVVLAPTTQAAPASPASSTDLQTAQQPAHLDHSSLMSADARPDTLPVGASIAAY